MKRESTLTSAGNVDTSAGLCVFGAELFLDDLGLDTTADLGRPLLPDGGRFLLLSLATAALCGLDAASLPPLTLEARISFLKEKVKDQRCE